jgi:hypothetical protein
MILTAGLPTISVMVNGKRAFKIGFDTGAPGGPHMTVRLADALGLEPIGEAQASDPSGKNPIAVKIYRFDRAVFGTVTVEGWIGTAAPVRPGKLESIDGIVGLDAFAGYIVTVDYAAGQIRLDRGALPPADGKQVFAYEDIIPVVPLTIEGRTIDAHIDTGNIGAALIIPESFAAGLSRKAEARPAGIARTVSNTINMFTMPLEGGVRIGAITLSVTDVRYPSVIEMANIGSPAFAGRVLRVDPANRRVTILPSGT